jgi:hypothetical protein
LLSAGYFPMNNVNKIPVFFKETEVALKHSGHAIGERAVADQGAMQIFGEFFKIVIENAFEKAFFAAEMIMDQGFIGFGNVRDLIS